jgi:hypothetical protein
MTPNVESNTLASLEDAISCTEAERTYKDRLKRWAIARFAPNKTLVIVDRFRSRSDADGYVQVLRQRYSAETFVVIVDKQGSSETALISSAPLN